MGVLPDSNSVCLNPFSPHARVSWIHPQGARLPLIRQQGEKPLGFFLLAQTSLISLRDNSPAPDENPACGSSPSEASLWAQIGPTSVRVKRGHRWGQGGWLESGFSERYTHLLSPPSTETTWYDESSVSPLNDGGPATIILLTRERCLCVQVLDSPCDERHFFNIQLRSGRMYRI